MISMSVVWYVLTVSLVNVSSYVSGILAVLHDNLRGWMLAQYGHLHCKSMVRLDTGKRCHQLCLVDNCHVFLILNFTHRKYTPGYRRRINALLCNTSKSHCIILHYIALYYKSHLHYCSAGVLSLQYIMCWDHMEKDCKGFEGCTLWKGLPPRPWRHLRSSPLSVTKHSAFLPRSPGHGSLHVCWTQVFVSPHLDLRRYSGAT